MTEPPSFETVLYGRNDGLLSVLFDFLWEAFVIPHILIEFHPVETFA